MSNTIAIGSATKPVYINASGQPVAINYELGEACQKGISDSTSASALSSTDTNVPTVRDIYYGMPTINGTKASTASICAPTSGGSSGQILVSSGGATPYWTLAIHALGGYSNLATTSNTVAHQLKISYSDSLNLVLCWKRITSTLSSSWDDEEISFGVTYEYPPLVLTTYSETNDEQCANMYGWVDKGSVSSPYDGCRVRLYANTQLYVFTMGLAKK